jgi:hypothetical protein
MHALHILLLALGLQTAQVTPRDRPREAQEGTAIIRGRVTDAEAGTPLPRVDLSLTLLGTRVQLDTVSDGKGAFEFTGLPAGKYSLQADPTRRGSTHRPSMYRTAPDGNLQWTTIVLREGDVFDKAAIALGRGYVISARVLDEDGLPVADALVKAEPIQVRGGFSSRSRSTDDLGAVRLWGFSPGLYRVCATPRSLDLNQRSSEGYIETCYPSAPAAEAQPVAITSADPPEVQIRLRRARLFTITGVVVDGHGPASSAMVSLVTVEPTGMTSRTIRNAGGAFIAQSLAPGEYFIKAELPYASDPDDTMRPIGAAAVNLQSADVENILVALAPPAIVRGHLAFEGGPSPPVRALTVQSYPPRGGFAAMGGRSSPPARINADLSFELRGMFGPRTIDVIAPSEWVVKSVRYRGQERISLPTEFKAEENPSALEIVLTNRSATLIARVQSSSANDAEVLRVLLFPADPNQWNGTGRTGISRIGVLKDGVYEFRGLRPAEYLVTIVPEGMPFRDGDTRALEELSKTAERITLLENDQRTIDLRR